MRLIIRDDELLKQLNIKDPGQAKNIINTTVFNFDHYDVDIRAFRDKRKKILERLGQ